MQYLNKKTLIALVAVIILLVGYGGAFYYYRQYKQVTRDPNAVAKKETADLVATVSKLILLPTGESPAVATIQDKEKLSAEPFFANALNGDKVLIYYAAKKAFLYRPSTNKIIEAAPLSTQQTASTIAPTIESTATTPVKPAKK